MTTTVTPASTAPSTADPAAPAAPSAPAAAAVPAMTNVESFEVQWKRFQGLFDELNRKLISNLSMSLGLPPPQPEITSAERFAVFGGATPTVDLFLRRIRDGDFKRVVVCCGAGISTAAGIPDFRSPDGLYAQLEKERLESPSAESAVPLPENIEECFSRRYFDLNPRPLARRLASMWPNVAANGAITPRYAPTQSHAFIKKLQDLGVLHHVFTQNIDGLELAAGVRPENVTFCHGNMNSAKCHLCGATFEGTALLPFVKDFSSGIPVPCPSKACCGSASLPLAHLRPDIVMFGEAMPKAFSRKADEYLTSCDAIIVMGTSLKVAPFSNLPLRVPRTTARLLLNRERCGPFVESSLEGYRDVAALGDLEELSRKALVVLSKASPKKPSPPPLTPAPRTAAAPPSSPPPPLIVPAVATRRTARSTSTSQVKSQRAVATPTTTTAPRRSASIKLPLLLRS